LVVPCVNPSTYLCAASGFLTDILSHAGCQVITCGNLLSGGGIASFYNANLLCLLLHSGGQPSGQIGGVHVHHVCHSLLSFLQALLDGGSLECRVLSYDQSSLAVSCWVDGSVFYSLEEEILGLLSLLSLNVYDLLGRGVSLEEEQTFWVSCYINANL